MVDKTNEKSKVSLFKKVFSRHKRKVKDPNHIDDLLDPAEDGCGAIDVSRIRNRARNNRSETTIVNGSLSNENNCDTRNEETDDMSMEKARNMLKVGGSFGFGKDLVVSIESLLPGIPYDSDTNNNDGRSCLCFGFREFPGVYLYPRALNKELQLRLAYEAVTGYCELGSTTSSTTSTDTKDCHDNGESQSNYGSHLTNIDLLPPKAHERVNELDNETETMWNLWKRGQIISIEDDDSSQNVPKRDTHKKNKNDNPQQNNFYRRFSKLSWATMGYHYDWAERCYHPQKKSRMPNLVAKLSTIFATATPTFEEAHGDDSTAVHAFTPSASIAKFYTTKSIMGGHRDDLEDPDAMDKPIVTISLGLPGIFVLGGPTKDQYEDDCTNNGNANEPAISPHPVRAIMLRPGDILIMGGASRLNYHCLARVLPHEAALEYDRRIGNNDMPTGVVDHNDDSCGGGDDDLSFSFASLTPKDLSLGDDETEASRSSCIWKNHQNDERDYLTEYLRHHRININVRQVYPDE